MKISKKRHRTSDAWKALFPSFAFYLFLTDIKFTVKIVAQLCIVSLTVILK